MASPILLFVCLALLTDSALCQTTVIVVPYASPSCGTGKYFDSTRLSCRDCGTNQTTSTDGLSCRCMSGFRTTQNYGGDISCDVCSGSTVPSKDGWSCVTCPTSNPKDATTGYCTACSGLSATAEYQINGTPYSSVTCVPCSTSTFVSPDGSHCIPCPNVLKMKSAVIGSVTNVTCDCSGTISASGVTYSLQTFGGICFATTDTVSIGTTPGVRVTGIQTTIPKVSSDTATANSLYLTTNLASSFGMCSFFYRNRSACQVLANACALILYRQTNVGSSGNRDACSLFNEHFSSRTDIINSNSDWKVGLPWLYHTNPASILSSEGITTQFTRLATIDFLAGVYTQNGTFMGYQALTDGLIQLCSNSRNELNAAYAFGTRFTSSCQLPVDDLFDQSKNPLRFFDIYLRMTSEGGTTQLFPVPVKILNVRSASNSFPNRGSNNNDFILTRRFFLVDNVGAVETAGSRASFVRYASSMQLDITLVSRDVYTTNGRIFPPVLTIEYSDIDSSSFGTGSTVSATFNVSYFSDLATFWEALKITMGVLCGLAALYAIFRSIAYKSRSGGENFEATIILHFIAFACSAVSNVFLIVIYGASVWYFSAYKNQNIFAFFIPTESQEMNLIVYIAIAGALKLLELIYMIVVQTHIDIFLIDWEKPKVDANALPGHGEEGGKSKAEVTYWRTILIANEWNEIQTHRKTNRTFTLLIVLFFMNVLGFENYASGDPQLNRFVVADEYRSSNVTIFRFALAMSVFIGVGGLQWLWTLLIHERFIEDKLRNFVDLCSIANISVFIRSPRSFGYYIHGESPHGTADVGVSQLHNQFEKEKQNDCGRRGLDNTDNQTFMMRLPPRFVSVFDSLYRNLVETSSASGASAKQNKQMVTIQKYHEMNNFLAKFVHRKPMEEMEGSTAVPIENYTTQPRKFMEDVLGMELGDNEALRMGGIFYSEDGTSFGDVLFYGNELSLMTFDLLLYSCVDLIFKSTALNVIITWLIGELFDFLRSQLGEINLSKKTLTNRQFLI